MRWFRFYAEALRDPKVRQLSDALFRTWIDILCLASEYGGEVPVTDLQHRLPHRSNVTFDRVCALVDRGLLEYGGGLIIPHNWFGRQYRSDSSTQRVQRHRLRKNNRYRNVSREGHVTAPEKKKVSKKEREAVAEMEKRLTAEIRPSDLASLKALKPMRGH